ncbi:ATP-binding protein [Candidatus Saccharibacteria bacterium]|nr:ATP-binding protein [Candidatus Saccharibacteria bacterium]
MLTGPPGTGKRMLAKAMPTIMPGLNHDGMLAVTHLQRLASHNYEQIITDRPVRASHHSASHISIIGGGIGAEIARYRRKLSGPILDRIDLHSSVQAVDHHALLTTPANLTADAAVKAHVLQARTRQQTRYKSSTKLNSSTDNHAIVARAKLSSALDSC